MSLIPIIRRFSLLRAVGNRRFEVDAYSRMTHTVRSHGLRHHTWHMRCTTVSVHAQSEPINYYLSSRELNRKDSARSYEPSLEARLEFRYLINRLAIRAL